MSKESTIHWTKFFLYFSAPILSSVLARIQFISLWSVAKNRSDYAHPPVSYIDCDILRGATWLLPLASLPPLLCSISQWSHSHPAVVSSPLLIYTIQGEGEGRVGLAPYLQPSIEGKGAAATVWYDWFLSDSSPDPLELAQFEEMFHSAGESIDMFHSAGESLDMFHIAGESLDMFHS